jgi:hypothetical protein
MVIELDRFFELDVEQYERKKDQMEYHKTITLKDGRACTLRNGTAEDGQALLNIFNNILR